MASPKLHPKGECFLSFDYTVAIENGIFRITLLVDEIPDDLKITYQFAVDNPWRIIEKLENTTNLTAFFEIKAFGFYHITVTLSSRNNAFTFDTPNYDHTANNAINYMTSDVGLVNWRAKLNDLYRSKYTEIKKETDFLRPLAHFSISHPNIYIIVHDRPLFPSTNRTEHEQKIWDNVDKYGDPIAIRDALCEKPPRVISHAWDEFKYENVADVANCIRGEAKFYIGERGVFTVSDSVSYFCNTISGHRITHGQPEQCECTIWHIGYCRIFGNGAPDWGTIDSFLQGLVNEKIPEKKIRVENFGYNNMCSHPDQPMKIANFLEPYMRDGDIVIFDSLDGFPNVKGVLHCDISQLLQRPHNYGECFFDRSHFTENGNRAIAARLFDFMQENRLFRRDTGNNSTVDITGSRVRDHLLPSEKLPQLEAYLAEITPMRPQIGSIVMNCNPFTLGHRYLIEQSAAKCERLFIFVVEEDKSIFPFADRIDLVRQGTKDIKNVTVIPSGKFIISSLTFTDYFGKSEMQDRTIDPSMDVELFGRYIAPQLGINIRFAGEEPLDNVTRQYNEAMGRILPRHGVRFEVIPRKESGGQVISASRVRKLLETNDFKSIKKIVPRTTLEYLKKDFISISSFEKKVPMNCFSISCLCNLSLGKAAWQSSEYGISECNAANVLNDDGKRDFGFHTKIEDNPWWEIDLKGLYKISHIKVANRRQCCQEKAGTLTVEVSESGEDDDWLTVHTGIIHWDGDLTFFLAGRIRARWVRLSLKEHTALHLANVEIWGSGLSVKQITPPAPEHFCLFDAPGLDGMDEISKNASITKAGGTLVFDFKDIYPIEAVVFEKPAATGWSGGESLRLEISRDGQSWQLIHEGLMFWAAKMYYPLRGEVIGRFLRLSPGRTAAASGLIKSFFSSKGGLGLEKARVFTKKADLTVIMARADGLGARLGALVNGAYLSKILNCDMKCVWAKSHYAQDYRVDDVNILGMSMDPVEEIFSKEFVDHCVIDNGRANDGSKIRQARNAFRCQVLNGNFSDAPEKIHAPLLIDCTRDSGFLGLNPNLAPNKDFGLRQAFYSLPFHQRIQSVIDMALQVRLPAKVAAIHLRTGDLVYGPVYRKILGGAMTAALDRVVSLPLAKMAAKMLVDEGFEVVAFSEDTKMLEILMNEFPAKLHPPSEFLSDGELSITQRGIFEMVLMSRAEMIFAPKLSAFSCLSSAIGSQAEYRVIHSLFTQDEMLNFYLTDLEANKGLYPPLNAAAAYKQLYVLYSKQQEPAFLLGLLDQAAELDPDNEFYPFYQAVEYYRCADFENGEKSIQRFLDLVMDIGRKSAIIHGRPAPADQEVIKKAAQSGFPSASRAMSLICETSGDQSAALYWRNAATYGDIRNLAPAGQARQSSDYDWGGRGRTDAANAFNDDGRRDFGFHTREDDHPWWEVELEELYNLHCIVLVNRRKHCQEKSITLTVEVSANKTGDEWVTVHTGLISWDGALTVPLMGQVQAWRVRLSLREKRMFHLAAVEVWGAPLGVQPKGSIEPKKFYLYDQEPKNELEDAPQAPPVTGPGLLTAELTAPVPLEALVIDKSGVENWLDLKIETSRDGQNWLTVHEGLMYWSGQMHYPIQGEVFARFVRLSSRAEREKGNAAGLSLKILVTKKKQDPCVIHRQNDGLGGRMLSLLNAMYLAEALNLPMGMVWPALNRPGFTCGEIDVLGTEVSEAEKVFDEKFRATHLRPELPLTYASKLQGKRGLARRNLISPALMDEPGLLHSSHSLDLRNLLGQGLAPTEAWELRRCFKSIGFAPELSALIETAEKFDLAGGMAAVHLRAGDLVYHSPHSTTFEDCLFNFETKGLPIQLARMSIEHALDAGFKNIIIFSDDVAVSQILADDYKVKYARQYWPAGELSNTQISLFEVVLMSRASVIYRADTSAFSRLAQVISEGAETFNVREAFKYEDILPYFQDDLNKNKGRYPAPHNAYSYGCLYRLSRGRQEADFLLELLVHAASAAPKNVTFKVFKALELFRGGRDAEGEAALREVFTFSQWKKSFDLVDQVSPALQNKVFINRESAELRPIFEEAAKRGNPFAGHMTSLIYNCQGKQQETDFWHETAVRNIS